METKKIRGNQLIWIQYENPKENGHFLTVIDRYRNVLSRVHKKFNLQTKKYEYTLYDPQGNEILKGENLLQIKKDFTAQKEIHFEKAHRERLANLQQIRQSKGKENIQEKKFTERKPQQNNRAEKNRKEELQELREAKSQERSQGLER